MGRIVNVLVTNDYIVLNKSHEDEQCIKYKSTIQLLSLLLYANHDCRRPNSP